MCYWEHLKEHIENLKNIGISWEHNGNIKNSPPPSYAPPRLFMGYMKFLFLNNLSSFLTYKNTPF